jgi:hypothetical protein
MKHEESTIRRNGERSTRFEEGESLYLTIRRTLFSNLDDPGPSMRKGRCRFTAVETIEEAIIIEPAELRRLACLIMQNSKRACIEHLEGVAVCVSEPVSVGGKC